MNRSALRSAAAVLCLLVSLVAVRPAMALSEAFLLLEGASEDKVRQSIGGLQNCKSLYAGLARYLVVHLACDRLKDLHEATAKYLTLEDVSRKTIWLVKEH